MTLYTPKPAPDLSSKRGARLHKAKLEQWYRDNGLPVPKFHIEMVPYNNRNGGKVYAVKSDLKLGVPKG